MAGLSRGNVIIYPRFRSRNMQCLGTISHPRLAQAFIDYMASKNIAIRLSSEPEHNFSLWVEDDTHAVIAQTELTAFLADPSQAKYQAASWDMAETRTASFQYPKVNFIDLIRAQAGPFTLTILSICLGIYILWFFGLQGTLFDWLHFPSMSGEKWQVWRYFTHTLLHFSILHIVFNCLWWWLLGGIIERKISSWKLIQIFLFSAMISGFAQFSISGIEFGGLSGVVYALLGYLWWLGWLLPEKGVSIPKAYVGFMLAWLVIGFALPMNIANMAHLFGLLTGCAIAFWDAKFAKKH